MCGKLRCTNIAGGVPKLAGSNGFSVKNITREYIQVQHEGAAQTTIFIAATKVYSGIHKKGVSCKICTLR